MKPQTDGDYKNLLTEVIKKQIIILGPDITLAKARNVAGLTVADDGTVVNFTGNPQELTQKLIEQFMELSGMIVKKTMEPLLAYHAASMVPTPQVSQPPIPQTPPQPNPVSQPALSSAPGTT